jgi:hypothetical protein
MKLVIVSTNYLYMHIGDIMHKSKYFEKPNNHRNYNYDVEDGFDFSVHGDVRINKPKENPRNN